LHFGIGDAAEATVQVRWPDGTQSDPMRMTAGDQITVTQPD
ncbi:MAG: hypothetical protein GY701_31420, partial [Sulfitobacter sp.]|nr:hypothetical protein [Sulfitobacter sp.]